jgi:hypothetical protein
MCWSLESRSYQSPGCDRFDPPRPGFNLDNLFLPDNQPSAPPIFALRLKMASTFESISGSDFKLISFLLSIAVS